MIVHRWEHVIQGHGPIASNPYWREIVKEHDCPNQDFQFMEWLRYMRGLDYWRDDIFYAWSTRELFDVFALPGAERWLADNGFVHKQYEVTDHYVKLNDGQVAFVKEKAKELE